MVVDETIVQQVLRVKKAYPSKTLEEIVAEVNKFFSKELMNERVTALAKSMVDGISTGRLLYRFYPLILFNTYEYKDSLKIVLDSRNTELIKLFVEFCKEFGIPSHLKRHGSSAYRVFRLLPQMPDLKLTEISEGKVTPTSGWQPFWKYLLRYHLVEGEDTDFIEIPNTDGALAGIMLDEAKKRFNSDVYEEVSRSGAHLLLKKR